MAAETGLLAWSNVIRFTMANDPGREVFQDQVNKHGFLFLDDYLNNILSGAKQDPMIELVKTPARKKPTHKAHLSSKSGLSTIYSNTTSEDIEKENTPLLNTFNQALLRNKDSSSSTATPMASTDKSYTNDGNTVSTPAPPVPAADAELQPPVEANLSVIAEDEEMSDRDPTVFHTPSSERAVLSVQGRMSAADGNVQQVIPPAKVGVDSLELIATTDGETPIPPTVLPKEPQLSPPTPVQAPVPASSVATEPLEDQRPVAAVMASEQPAQLAEEKVVKAPFPSLPGPIPLRKSMRFPQEASSNNAAPPGAPTPGAPPGGKRTSWLKKAREVKAMESLTRVGISTSSQIAPNPLKRKSDEATATQSASDAKEERHRKSIKVDADQSASPPLEPQSILPTTHKESSPKPASEVKLPGDTSFTAQEGMLDRLKKTVEGLGSRVGKSFGNALGTNTAATALAEARAAAEARIAQRNSQDDEEMKSVDSPPPPQTIRLVNTAVMPTDNAQDKRLSVSELFPPMDSTFKIKSRAGSKSPSPKLQIPPSNKFLKDSPSALPRSPLQSPTSRQLPIPPIGVFDRPQPVFVPPVPSSPLGPRPKNPQSGPSKSIFSAPPNASGSRGVASPKRQAEQNSTVNSNPSAVQAWSSAASEGMDFSIPFGSKKTAQQLDDDDDSWPIDERLPPGVQWNFSAKDDSLTWSTLRSESQRGDTGTWRTAEVIAEEVHPVTPGPVDDEDAESEMDIVDLTENITTATNMEAVEIPRSTSQLSMASSQGSFSSTASKSTINAPGTAKKGKPEVKKVLQLANVAAKKQQEENDKRAARLREMEARRQAVQQKKLEEEKQKAIEQEKKAKEDGERRKREREENTDKRPLKQPTKKDEDATKKRKIAGSESEKKELKKVPSKSVLKPSLKQPTVPSSSSSLTGTKAVEIKAVKPTTAWKGKAKAVPKMHANYEDDVSQPSQLVQTQMAARVQTQIQASKAPEKIQSESIELPDINSEYSDSDDEDRKRTYDPPNWAQSPELKEALRLQSTINPDDIFGAVKPLKMEEIFKSRTSRFRARTSSANWAGTDGLTLAEERAYAKRMGFC